ncbi:MAG TPA: glycosyltransferase [bacterium]|nr:glycosyltransferase [bacterium]HOL93450.1 glycosyltransferase [bacterium]HPP02753.1 glycosyltransferase [bacterium]
MTSVWSYCDRSDRGYGLFKRRIFHALERHGWTTSLAEAPLLEASSKAVLREHLERHAPDWIFLINQSAGQFYEYLEIPPHRRPYTTRKFVWYLDDPHFFVDRPFEPLEHVFCFDESYLDYLRRFSPRVCGFFPVAADHETPGARDSRFACEVSFVGGVISQVERRAQLAPEMQIYVDRLVDLQLQFRHKTFFELADEYPIAPGKRIQITPPVAHYLYWEANNRYRLRVVQSLADFDLRIYGNEDWISLLQDTPLAGCYSGPIDPAHELPAVFASSAVNLNIHSLQCRGSLNQRDFNAPLAGGFLLSDWVPAVGRYFVPGKEAVYWSDVDDLRRKTVYYLAHPEERERIVQQGRERIMREHTYNRRVEEWLRWMGF